MKLLDLRGWTLYLNARVCFGLNWHEEYKVVNLGPLCLVWIQ